MTWFYLRLEERRPYELFYHEVQNIQIRPREDKQSELLKQKIDQFLGIKNTDIKITIERVE